jgi:zinc protease
MTTMAFFPRAYRVPVLLSLATALAAPALAQVAVPPVVAVDPGLPSLAGIDRSAWLYKGSDITQDPAWHFGTLANGLRYAVRRNQVPPGQVSVRVRVDAGSLAETDAQRGYAHFIEHLTFRGSAYVPDGEAKRVWQRFGATFGSDTNAQTSPIATTYKLDLPAATQGSVDESLKILSGMMAAPAIVPAAVDAERPVVMAEQREQPGVQVRLSDASNALFFAGQPLATRSPIGTVASLEAASADGIRAFHDRWYRPERTVVIVSGDMDTDLLEKLVVKNFAGWKGIGPSSADPDFGQPDPHQPTAASIVEPGAPVLVVAETLRPWHFNADTVVFNQKRWVDILATRLLSRRLEQRARAGGSFLQASVTLDDVLRSANVTTVQVVPAGDDWQKALRDVRGVIAQAMAAPPTPGEIDRELVDLEAAMRSDVETARVEASAKQADDMGSALDIRETVTSPAASFAVFRDARAKGMFTPAALLASTRKLFRGTATRALVNLHAADPAATGKLAAVLASDPVAAKARAVAARKTPPLPALGVAGTVAARAAVPGLDVDQVTFANGVHLLLHASDTETGRVYVRVRFGGGYGALLTRPSDAWAGDDALMASGIGRLDADDIEAATAGRNIQLQFGIGEDAFSIAGLTSPADYPEELRLIAAKLEHPGWDPAPVLRARATALASYDGQASSPGAVIGRDLDGLLHDGDPRWATPNRAQIAGMTPATYRALWEPLLASGPIEVSVFGDVKADEAIAAVARTFGALKPRTATVSTATPYRFPAHNAAPVVETHDGSADQAAAVIAWPTGSGAADIAESRQLDVLAQIFSDRLFDKLRNAAGASYSPSVASQWPVGGGGVGRFVAVGQVKPDKTAFFFTLAREIAADLVAHPVGDDELRRLLGSTREEYARVSTGNLFWLRLLGGASFDSVRFDAARSIGRDLAGITPASLQAVAAKYLRPDRDWTMAVVPKGDGPAKAAAAPAGAQ